MSDPLKDTEGFERRNLHNIADFRDKRVLEIGCGEGRLTWRYAGSTRLTIGIDPDPDAVRVAMIDRASDLKGRAEFIRASSLHLPFARETFDIAVLAWSL